MRSARKHITARLLTHALDFARAEGLPVVPLCPYVAEYIRQHPEYEDVVAPRRLWHGGRTGPRPRPA